MQSKNRRAFLAEGLTAAVGLGSVFVGCGGSGDADAIDSPDVGGQVDSGGHGGATLDSGPGGFDASAPEADAVVEAMTEAATDGPDAAIPGPRPTTTVRERIRGILPSEKQSSSDRNLWGVTTVEPGELHTRIDWLDVASIVDTPSGPAGSMLYMAQLSDIHILDEESPARTINIDQITSPSWRKQEAHNCQVLDAMVRKLHQFNALRRLDCALITGDCIDNNQRNELEWFLGIMEGGVVVPNSGDLEDPRKGPDNDPHDAFEAYGMGGIPWYMVAGNHDVLIQGNLSHGVFTDYSIITGDPTRDKIRSIAMGRVNPPACNEIPPDESPLPDRCIPTDPGDLDSGDLVPDSERRHLSKEEWFEMVLAAGGLPAGHGFHNYAASSGDGDYVAEPTPGIPIRLVMLDTNSKLGAQGNYGRINDFLQPVLEQALADNMAVIVVSHHYTDAIPSQGKQIRSTLTQFPNVLLHLVGHGHRNRVTAIPGHSPEFGYWEVQTCGLVSWPQQGRLIEVVDNRDGSLDLWLTLFDFDVDHQPTGKIVAASRFLAMYEIHNGEEGGGAEAEGKVHDRNVILPVAIPEGVRAAFAGIAGKEIESLLFA